MGDGSAPRRVPSLSEAGCEFGQGFPGEMTIQLGMKDDFAYVGWRRVRECVPSRGRAHTEAQR